ncbi:MAG: 1,4-dihydroxy-6-naphthoate synthase [Chitinophagaceae bacterium]|jgi:1,4-dihydroxy-6-naphthoate synthase|nr:1,4-dihydroxy-6-naphthoate synthase [Chitinophagaceae bacterium]MCE2973193.1 1,4-dihydroxy-6-naphthoate synthase [Sediminibacterium sp.]MCA6468516.1 1,4-dihydroxy-6-naphthoate synthase [Chitinophagaceae bacterium]MCA6478017.1 1,4-dihydroxy-6-naphthoate synthase [Chitinophagaceae bacterium]MCA6479342.1 1,4-dihydroxy-6-naphthoate synthase [Chitinophagaceae bacterium]
MKLSIGFSPCPNDTFIFDALVNGKIDTGGIEFEPVLEDVQTLNQWAIQGRLDVTKISYGVLPNILSHYAMLNSGGAMGRGVGPLLITTADNSQLSIEQLSQLPVAIPGENTTAHLLLSHALPAFQQKKFMLFHEIEDALIAGEVASGVIIHENRFTYADKGLVLLNDLGKFWEESLNSPIPLGGIAMKRTFPLDIQRQVDQLIQSSLRQAEEALPELSSYVQLHAHEMDPSVQRMHIDLYVNEFSRNAGAEGKHAVSVLMDAYQRLRGITPDAVPNIFID